MNCPSCGVSAEKVIYAGFPMKLCCNQECNTLWGLWSFIPGFYFNGAFMSYTGGYWPALWSWLKGDFDD